MRNRRLRLPAALILSFVLVMAFTAAPVSAASSESGLLHAVKAFFLQGSDKPVVEDVDYDHRDREVEFEFKGKVKYKNVKVKITRNGKNKAKKITDKDSDELEVEVKKLTYGKTYHYKISGVKKKNGRKYYTLTGTFKAVD
ncbi:MAG: hypothetical protein IJ109_08215 [Firmicutes bacterium]|nr:hypothetical protein [Bacillota bacterium]